MTKYDDLSVKIKLQSIELRRIGYDGNQYKGEICVDADPSWLMHSRLLWFELEVETFDDNTYVAVKEGKRLIAEDTVSTDGVLEDILDVVADAAKEVFFEESGYGEQM